MSVNRNTKATSSVGRLYVASLVTLADGANLTFGSTTGTKIGGTGSKLALYGTTPLLQPARLGQVTDGSGGVANDATGIATVGGAYSQTVLANALATITRRLNQVEAALSAAGGGIGVTA